MTTDITRSTHRPARHYKDVRQQQGRVALDADWNEQVDIQAHLDETTRLDTIGPSGTPKDAGGFLLAVAPDGSDLVIAPGRYYVDGILCELDGAEVPVVAAAADTLQPAEWAPDGRDYAVGDWLEVAAQVVRVTAADEASGTLTVSPAPPAGAATIRRLVAYRAQPDLPDPGAPADGTYLAYLDAWSRPVTALEDPAIREVALLGPDTTTRTQTVAQVRLLRVGDAGLAATCDGDFPEWDALLAPPPARLAARSNPAAPVDTPCVVPAAAGYRRLENQLYRVEVHAGGAAGAGASYKWSRDNGSVVRAWTAQSGDELTVAAAGPDQDLAFAPGQWVELTDDARELAGLSGTLVLLTKAEGRTLTIDPTTATGSVDRTDFPRNPKVRRWDSAGALPLDPPAPGDGWVPLEDGVEVRFAAVDYAARDHWLVPARTATGDVEWPRDLAGAPLPRPPAGVRHHYARLALVGVSGGALTVLADCRTEFPPLSRICADDVCFDDTTCGFPGVETVQQALDRLCEEHGLAFHKQHLHGWGIVCGLQVECGGANADAEASGDSVLVRSGYAIQCDGADVVLAQDAKVPVLELGSQLLDGDGELCLTIGLDAELRPAFAVEPLDPKADSAQSLLAGTLLEDFLVDCVEPIRDVVVEEAAPEPEPAPAAPTPAQPCAPLTAGPGHQKLSVLTNVAFQPLDPASGRSVYVSPREDALLRDLYQRLRERLADKTFCALFDGARPFPDYPFANAGVDTIFGRGNHDRLRLRPGSRGRTGAHGSVDAFTFGSGLDPTRASTAINRYDLKANRLVAQVDPIAGTPLTAAGSDTGVGAVQDVAFSPDGRMLYVAVVSKSGQDTFFRAGRLTGTGISWRPLATIAGVRLRALATTHADPDRVYAVGEQTTKTDAGAQQVRGTGLYRIDPESVQSELQPLATFNATGHLAITADGRAFAGAAPDGTAPTAYDRILQYAVPTGALVSQAQLPQGLTGTDELALFTHVDHATRETVYVGAGPDAQGMRYVLSYDMGTAEQVAAPIPFDDTPLHLASFTPTHTLLVAPENGDGVRMIDMEKNALVEEHVLPVQVGVGAIAADHTARRVHVLNTVSNTVTTASGALLLQKGRFDFDALAAYRAGVVEAFADLAGATLQYLKDCFCHHLLVSCPTCAGDEKLYLACVSIRGGQVYKVCNFSRRRYVKSFPTMEYWLSLVPVLPLVGRAVRTLCCSVLPDFFSRYKVPGPDEAASTLLTAAQLRRVATLAQAVDVRTRLSGLLDAGSLAGGVALSSLAAQPARPVVDAAGIVGRPTNAAVEILRRSGVEVQQATLQPGAAPSLGSTLGALLRAPRPGSIVTLYEENGKVRSYTVAETPQQQVSALSQQLASKDAELASLRSAVEQLQASHAELASTTARLLDQHG